MLSRKIKQLDLNSCKRDRDVRLDRNPMEQVGLVMNYANELFDAAMAGDRLAAIDARKDLSGALIGLTNLLSEK